MALVVKDRVRVTTTTTGTTDFTLGGAVTGYQSFSVIGNGNQTYYAAQDPATGDWEVGIGTYSSTGPTLSRDTILESSNAGSKVVFAAGSKDVFCTYPAERSVYLDVAGSYPVQSTFNTITATTATLTNGTITTTPTSANDIANKTYVDTIASSGITYHTPVKYEVPNTTGNLNATYNNGTGGVGATLTNAGTKAAFAPDGPTAQVGDRILIYNQTNQFENGIYEVTTVGTPDPGGTNWVLTRTSDADSYGVKDPNKLGNGDAFFITSGNTGAGETYVCNTTGTITFGTTAITFVQISDATLYTAGTGLTLTSGTQFNIANTGVVAATYGSASTVPVIAVNAQGQITSATNTSIAITAGAVSGLAASATTDTTNAANISSGTLNSARLSGSYTGITGVGTLTAGTWNGSVIGATYGGTGLSSYAVGDLIYADTTTSLAKLADVVSGNVLLSGGVGTAPAWGQVGLTTHVTGTLPVGNGGTGITAGTSGGIPYFSASNTIASSAALTASAIVIGGGAGVAPSTITTGTGVVTALGVNTGTAGAFVVNGGALGTPLSGTLTNATGLPLSTGVTGTLPVANGGTGQTSYTDGQLLIGNTATGGLTKATLTAGSGVSITNGNGSISIAASASSTLTISNKTGSYTVVSGDNGTIINCTSGNFTVALTAAASLGSGFNCWVWNTSSVTSDVITIDPSGAETIDGKSTLVLRRGEGTQIVCDGTNWQTGDKKRMRGYAENISTAYASPVASGDAALSIGAGSTASGVESLALGKGVTASPNYSTAIGTNSAGNGSQAAVSAGAMALGGSYAAGTDAFAAAIGTNSSSYGTNGNNAVAIGNLAKTTGGQSVAIGYNMVASGTQSTAIGVNGTASNVSSICISAYSSTVSGSYAMGFGYTNVTGTGAMAFGTYWQASATGNGSIAMGGWTSTITSSGTASVAIGDENTASAASAYAFGTRSNSAIIGKYAYANGRFASTGDAQTGAYVLRRGTTNAVATVLTTDGGSTPGVLNQIILPNSSAFSFHGTIIARQQAAVGSNYAAWEIKGALIRDASAATTVLGTNNVNKLSASSGASAWTVALSADTTNGGLAITVTGAAATNIRWVAAVHTSELTYA